MVHEGRVLVSTGSESVYESVSLPLRSMGLLVEHARDRASAVRTLLDVRTWLVVVDWDMPDAALVAATAPFSGTRLVSVNDDLGVARRGGAVACVGRGFSAPMLLEAAESAARF